MVTNRRKWYLKNREYCCEYAKIMRKRNPQKEKERYNRPRTGGKKYLILKMNNYACSVCGISNNEHIGKYKMELSIHHKDKSGSRANKNNSLNNLMVVCSVCHAKIHIKKKEYCINGHKLNTETTYIRKDNGQRQCVLCRRANITKYNKKRGLCKCCSCRRKINSNGVCLKCYKRIIEGR